MADDQASQFISSQRKARGNEPSLYWYNTCSVLFLYNIYVDIFIFVFAFCFFFFQERIFICVCFCSSFNAIGLIETTQK